MYIPQRSHEAGLLHPCPAVLRLIASRRDYAAQLRQPTLDCPPEVPAATCLNQAWMPYEAPGRQQHLSASEGPALFC